MAEVYNLSHKWPKALSESPISFRCSYEILILMENYRHLAYLYLAELNVK